MVIENLTFFEHLPMHRGVGDDVVEAFQLPYDEGTVSWADWDQLRMHSSSKAGYKRRTPWTSIRDIEMVSPLLRWEFGTWLFGYEIAEFGRQSVKGSCFLVGPVGDGVWCFVHLPILQFSP